MYATSKYVPLGQYCQRTNMTRKADGSGYETAPECTWEQAPACDDKACKNPKDLFYDESKVLPNYRLDPNQTSWGQSKYDILNFGNGTGKSDNGSGYLKMDLGRNLTRRGNGRSYGGNAGCVAPPQKVNGAWVAKYDYNPDDCESKDGQEQCNQPFTPTDDEIGWKQEGCKNIEGKYATVNDLSCVRSAQDGDFKPQSRKKATGSPTGSPAPERYRY